MPIDNFMKKEGKYPYNLAVRSFHRIFDFVEDTHTRKSSNIFGCSLV